MIKNMDTIAQYKIMLFIQANFYEEAITVTKVDKAALKGNRQKRGKPNI